MPALFAYEGIGATVVQALKFRDGRRLITPLADAAAAIVRPVDGMVCTWLPTSGRRRRARGFDQSELLARAIARRLTIPAASILRRSPGQAQTGRSRADRAQNVVFRTTRAAVGPLLVIDDVCTTGATIRAAALALEEIGAESVQFVTVARTP